MMKIWLRTSLFVILLLPLLSGCLGSSGPPSTTENPTQTPYIIVVSPTPPLPTITAQEPSPAPEQAKQLAQVVEIVD
jgi:hypothetical protein